MRAGGAGGWGGGGDPPARAARLDAPEGQDRARRDPDQCALREVAEETGYRCHLGRFIGEVEYLDRRSRVKIVSYWLMQPIDGAFEPTLEVDELRWLSLGDAAQLLDYQHDRELLESVNIPLATAPE